MGRFFWIIMGVLGFALIMLIANSDSGSVLGMENGTFGSAVYMSIWAAILAAGVLGSGMRFGDIARQMAIWAIIILVLVTGYLFRYEAQDMASRFTGGLLPGSPISRTADNGREEVTLIRASSRHFEVRASVNNKPVHFLIDTGASAVVLNYEDAVRVGINPKSLIFSTPVFTANGKAMAAESRLDILAIGSIVRTNQKILVSAPGAMKGNLLGMSFLETLSSYEVRGDRMFLRD